MVRYNRNNSTVIAKASRKIALLTYYLSCREHLFSSIIVSESWNGYTEKETLHRSSHTLEEILSGYQGLDSPKAEQAELKHGTWNKVQTSH